MAPLPCHRLDLRWTLECPCNHNLHKATKAQVLGTLRFKLLDTWLAPETTGSAAALVSPGDAFAPGARSVACAEAIAEAADSAGPGSVPGEGAVGEGGAWVC